MSHLPAVLTHSAWSSKIAIIAAFRRNKSLLISAESLIPQRCLYEYSSEGNEHSILFNSASPKGAFFDLTGVSRKMSVEKCLALVLVQIFSMTHAEPKEQFPAIIRGDSFFAQCKSSVTAVWSFYGRGSSIGKILATGVSARGSVKDDR